MQLETTAKRVEDKDEHVKQYNYDNFDNFSVNYYFVLLEELILLSKLLCDSNYY